MDKEQEEIQRIVSNFSEIIGSGIGIHNSLPFWWEGYLTIDHKQGKVEIPFLYLDKVNIKVLRAVREKLKDKGVIISKSIRPTYKEHLNKFNIGFIEGSGEARINLDSLFFCVKTLPQEATTKKNSNAGFGKAGLPLTYLFLSKPDKYLEYSISDLEEASGLPRGTVSKVRRDLVSDNYIEEYGEHPEYWHEIEGEYRDFFKAWVEAFKAKIYLHLERKRYKLPPQKSLQSLIKEEFNGIISGELAVEKLLDGFKAKTAVIYANDLENLASTLGLEADDNGEIILAKQFWKKHDLSFRLAGLPLIYVDLIESKEKMNVEIAELLLDQKSKREDGV